MGKWRLQDWQAQQDNAPSPPPPPFIIRPHFLSVVRILIPMAGITGQSLSPP